MPPKGKKSKAPPKNAFYFFMLDWKAEKEEQGQRFKGLNEVAEVCSEDWKYLPEYMKNKYKEMEKEAKKKDKNDIGNKYNSLGVSFDVIEKAQEEEARGNRRMLQDIHGDILRISSSLDALTSHNFYLVHANIYCYWGAQQIYIPSEVAISKFNLRDGIIDTYHVFPEPCTENGDIPLGYKYQVLETSKAVHEIPEPNENDSLERDWSKILADVVEFLRHDGGSDLPPLYTLFEDSSNLNCYVSAVKKFLDHAAADSGIEFRVYDLTHLFFKLYGSCQEMAERLFGDDEKAFPVEGLAYQQLTRDVYNFSAGICCSFHDSTEHFHNCSLSFAKRWVFHICDFCCKALRIELIPGQHCLTTAKIIRIAPASKEGQSSSTYRAPSQASTSASNTYSDHCDDSQGVELQHGMKTLALEDIRTSSSHDEWSTVGKGLSRNRKIKTEDGKTSASGSEVVFIDRSKEPDPRQTRVLKIGQAANVISEIMPEALSPSVRLPKTRGRGELMAQVLLKQQQQQQQQQQLQQQQGPSVASNFSADDFPAIGAGRPGRLAKPIGSGWGRGFLPQ